MDIVSGIIQKVNYYNEENGYTVAVIEVDSKHKNILVKKGKLYSNNLTVIGTLDRKPYEDEEYSFEGEYFIDPKYGLEFKFNSFSRKEINNRFGVISYLTSDLFPGIGPKAAEEVVNKLGVNAVELIRINKDVLDQTNLTKKQKKTIYEGIINDHNSQEIVIYLLSHGISINMAHKIVSALGPTALDQIKNNPYILMEKVERIGFKKNDTFALSIGVLPTSLIRLKAATSFILQEAIYNTGDSYISKIKLYEAMTSYLKQELDHELFENLLKTLVENKKIHIDEQNNIFDYLMYRQENTLAEEIVKLLKGIRNPNKPLKKYSNNQLDQAFKKVQETTSIDYNKEQLTAIRSAFTEPLTIITGGPGTGKTTIVNAILKMYVELNNNQTAVINDTALLAPTGRAAKRMMETTSVSAMTIHRYLGYQGGNIFTHSRSNPTSSKLVIIDESSMMDIQLAYRLFTALDPDARVIIVGDIDQLPSVGPGQVLKDLIDTKEIKTIRLNKIHRQAENSSIIKLAHSINEGYIPENILSKFPDRIFIQTNNELLPQMLKDLITKTIEKGKNIATEVQILIPMYRGEVGINEINNVVQELVNPFTHELNEVKHFGRILRLNDKVIQLVNRSDKKIMNGEIGFIDRINYDQGKFDKLVVRYDNQKVSYNFDELEDINLAYAISVHKAQGSEFDIVIMPITTKHFIMLKRKLIYTAITRAKKTLMLIGDVTALRKGIYQFELSRKTILKDKIIELLSKKESITSKKENDIMIDDNDSAFDTIGEKDFGTLTFDDFEESKN